MPYLLPRAEFELGSAGEGQNKNYKAAALPLCYLASIEKPWSRELSRVSIENILILHQKPPILI